MDDCLVTTTGESHPVIWLGHRHVDCRRHPRPEAVWPVRVRAHAFGPGRPSHDLWLSPDHAIFAEGVLVPVKWLQTRGVIDQEAVAHIVYWHVELSRHEVILANGLPVESYLDTGDRASFVNSESPTAVHPMWGRERDTAWLIRDTLGYAPLTVTGSEVTRIRAGLLYPVQMNTEDFVLRR